MTDPEKSLDLMWNSKTELLVERADLNDAFEAEAKRHRSRGRIGFGLFVIGLVALAVGLTLDTSWLTSAVVALQVPVFGLGLHLMAGHEVRRFKREVESVEKEIQALESGEKET